MQSSLSYKTWINPFSSDHSREERLFFLLRLGMLGCFVGHGMWGLMFKPGWVPFFEVFGISKNTAHYLMPLVGTMDILVGIFAFVRPNRALLYYALFWTIFTALLRPISGMGFSEFFERAGNYGLPLAMLLLYPKPKTFQDLTSTLGVPHAQALLHSNLERCLKWSIALLLMGHGGLAAFVHEHPVITRNFSFVFGNIETSALQVFGILEIVLGALFIWKPKAPYLLAFILFFKIAIEVLHPIAGSPKEIFETIERAGDYMLPLALMTVYNVHMVLRSFSGKTRKQVSTS